MTEGLSEQLIRGGQVFLAVPEEHDGPVLEGGPGPVGGEGRIALPGLPGNEHHLPSPAACTATGGHTFGCRGNEVRLGTAAHHPDLRGEGQTGGKGDRGRGRRGQGLPEHFGGLHRLGEAPQLKEPRLRASWRLRRPATRRTTSAARICASAQGAQSGGPETTGSPK